jgi:predicted dehydrogenase
MDKQTPIRIGIVGCGYQGGILAQAIGRTKTLQVTACADPNQTAAAQVAKLAGNVASCGSVEALL